MEVGYIVWFNNQRGWGFVNYENKPLELFAYHDDALDLGPLDAGQRVVFEVDDTPKGKFANILRVYEEV